MTRDVLPSRHMECAREDENDIGIRYLVRDPAWN